jgi:short-subunit dehydrogenase
MNIVIIGATSGIGKSLFQKYATEDNRIGIIGRRGHLLDELRQQYPQIAIAAKADITNTNEIEQAITMLRDEFRYIDLAIVCSGTGDINTTLNYAIEQPTINTNVVGWTFVVDLIYNLFEFQGFGHLVAITSIGGQRGESMAPAYSASKAYQINYLESLRKRAYKSNSYVRVTDIRPGLVDTAMAKGDGLFWVMPVEKVASQIISAIRKKKSKAYVTKRWHLLAIINKNLPYRLYKRM